MLYFFFCCCCFIVQVIEVRKGKESPELRTLRKISIDSNERQQRRKNCRNRERFSPRGRGHIKHIAPSLEIQRPDDINPSYVPLRESSLSPRAVLVHTPKRKPEISLMRNNSRNSINCSNSRDYFSQSHFSKRQPLSPTHNENNFPSSSSNNITNNTHFYFEENDHNTNLIKIHESNLNAMDIEM